MRHLNLLIDLGKRLNRHARALKMSYSCDVKLLGYSAAEMKIEDGETYEYPALVDLNIENWNTWKGSFRLSDGMFIREGMDLNGPGIRPSRLYRSMILELREHAKRIALINEAHETNSIIFNNSLVVVENADAREFGRERVFTLIDENGNESNWLGHSAEDAVSNAYPWIKNFKLVMIRLKEVQGE
jgi:hypothetical protein